MDSCNFGISGRIWTNFLFYNCLTREIDVVLLKQDGLPHIFPVAVHLRFFSSDKAQGAQEATLSVCLCVCVSVCDIVEFLALSS